MGFHFFAKKVYDEDLCFIRDLLEIGITIEEVTNLPALKTVIKGTIEKCGLNEKLQEIYNNSHYLIQNCYPSNKEKKACRAKELLTIHKLLSLDQHEKEIIMQKELSCVLKMNFSTEEELLLGAYSYGPKIYSDSEWLNMFMSVNKS